MAEEASGITITDELIFAMPLGPGKWMQVEGSMACVDGYCHKIEFPGFITRSGESFGITATFHVVEKTWMAGTTQKADIARWVVANGLLKSADTVERGIELSTS